MVEKSGDEESGGQEKSLEMRVAELEDKLAQMHITEDEIRAYQKVAGMLGQAGGAAAGGPMPWAPMAAQAAPPCAAAEQQLHPQQPIFRPIARPITNWQPIIRPIWRPIIPQPCWPVECGPGLPGNIPGGFDVPGQEFGQLGG